MRVLNLYIQNSGVFSNTLIDFTDNGNPQSLICLSGINGSGKTTVMDIILNMGCFLNPELSLNDIFFDRLKPNILTQTEFAQLDLLIDDKLLSLVLGEKENIQRSKTCQQAFIIEDDIKSLAKKFEDAVVKYPEDRKKNRNNIGKVLDKIGKMYSAEGFSDREVARENHKIFQDLFEKIERSIHKKINSIDPDGLPFIHFFNAHDREILDIRYDFIPRDDSEYQVVYRYSPIEDDLKKLLVFYDYAYADKFEELKNWINKYVLEDKSIHRIHRPEFKVVIKTKKGDEHGVEYLSSGEESLLIIAVQLYLKASENSILLIDDIDQSLHPEYQERVMRIICQIQREKNCQIILSSHSRFIWNFFSDKSIIRLNEVIR